MVILDITIVYPLDKGAHRKGVNMVSVILNGISVVLNIAIIVIILRRWNK